MKKINIKAFSLIELLIVIALIALTAAFGVPAFNRYGNRSDLNNAAQQVQATLEKAYSNSITPPKSSVATANEIHTWIMNESQSGQVIFSRAFYQPKYAPGSVTLQGNADSPGDSSSFSAEIVTIPDYMKLSLPNGGWGKIFCNYAVAAVPNCIDSTHNVNLFDNSTSSFELILSSDKVDDQQYRIKVTSNPYSVRINAEDK